MSIEAVQESLVRYSPMPMHSDSQSDDKVMEVSGDDPLTISAHHYFFKPMAVFFNAFHLRAFETAGVETRPPALDVGCSDGEYGVMLAEVLGETEPMTGIDISEEDINRAGTKAQSIYKEMIACSATSLPFDDKQFNTAFSNASLLSIDPGLDDALREINRVLSSGGTFYASVCTNSYEYSYWLARILNGVGLRSLGRRYMDSMNRRMQQAHLYSPEEWISRIETAGFEVVDCFGFFPLRLTRLWSFMAWTPFRIHGIVSRIPWQGLHNFMRRFYERCFRGVYSRTPRRLPPGECGYIFIKAVKR